AQPFELHFSNHLEGDIWVVELRRFAGNGSTEPYMEARAGDEYVFPIGGRAGLLRPHSPSSGDNGPQTQVRLWQAEVDLPMPVDEFLKSYGYPIRYSHVRQSWPASFYQTA
ncbi:MAG: hypothetical protein R3335_03935, partial [Anaerolineales bacterium]|nr:hypothetical protein [Anaerolineales bacterium]